MCVVNMSLPLSRNGVIGMLVMVSLNVYVCVCMQTAMEA